MDYKTVNPEEAFERLGGLGGDLPVFNSKPQFTLGGNAYFTKPGVAMLAKPSFESIAIETFLEGFPKELEFPQYVDDQEIDDGAGLVKTAGQTCYMSFGPNRTKNAEAQKYLNNILASGHGSVLEHAQYSFLIWGADRAFTHELVRHRSGCAFSQVSQRYVDGKTLRFVERPEYQEDPALHEKFLARVDRAASEYDEIAKLLSARQQQGDVALSSEKKTEMRKKVNQAARSCLPNETEAPIVFSGNVRSLRHVMEMRASGAADVPIRMVASRLFLCMQRVEPLLFADYKLLEAPDGTLSVSTDWRKV